MQHVPRLPAAVSLGGSLRASRAAQLARPEGPLAAVDLADGRALLVRLVGRDWIESDDTELMLPQPPAPEAAPVAAEPARRRRLLGPALALAGALGAAIVALATGFSPAPAPAIAAPAPRPSTVHPAARAPARGGRSAALLAARTMRSPPAAPAPRAPPAAAQPPVAPPAPPAAIVPPAAPPPAPPSPPGPPPLPALPSAPSL